MLTAHDEHADHLGPSPRRRRFAAAAIAAVAVVGAAAILVARDDSASMVADRGPGVVNAVEDALQPPGTEIVPGVTVQHGSSLVGTAFPGVDVGGNPVEVDLIGWQAALVVDGDPLEVWDRYVAELGLDERAQVRGACAVWAFPPVANGSAPPSRLLTDPVLRGENHLDCHAYIGEVMMSMAVGLQQCAGGRTDPCPPRSVSHLYIRDYDDPQYANLQGYFGGDSLRWERGTYDGMSSVPAPLPTGPVVTPRVEVGERSHLPEPGERLDDHLDYFLNGTGAALVPDGARSLVAPGMPIECNSGLVAVLEVPGRPEEAIRRFDDADREIDAFPGIGTGEDAQGRTMAAGVMTAAGGFGLSFVAVDQGGDSSTVLVTECGD